MKHYGFFVWRTWLLRLNKKTFRVQEANSRATLARFQQNQNATSPSFADKSIFNTYSTTNK